jgi:hypothetical protein
LETVNGFHIYRKEQNLFEDCSGYERVGYVPFDPLLFVYSIEIPSPEIAVYDLSITVEDTNGVESWFSPPSSYIILPVPQGLMMFDLEADHEDPFDEHPNIRVMNWKPVPADPYHNSVVDLTDKSKVYLWGYNTHFRERTTSPSLPDPPDTPIVQMNHPVKHPEYEAVYLFPFLDRNEFFPPPLEPQRPEVRSFQLPVPFTHFEFYKNDFPLTQFCTAVSAVYFFHKDGRWQFEESPYSNNPVTVDPLDQLWGSLCGNNSTNVTYNEGGGYHVSAVGQMCETPNVIIDHPSDITASSGPQDYQLTVEWDEVQGAVSYYIHLIPDIGLPKLYMWPQERDYAFSHLTVAQVPAGTSSFTFDNLNPCVSWHPMVFAQGPNGYLSRQSCLDGTDRYLNPTAYPQPPSAGSGYATPGPGFGTTNRPLITIYNQTRIYYLPGKDTVNQMWPPTRSLILGHQSMRCSAQFP